MDEVHNTRHRRLLHLSEKFDHPIRGLVLGREDSLDLVVVDQTELDRPSTDLGVVTLAGAGKGAGATGSLTTKAGFKVE